VDLRAAARHELGTLGDPADLIVCEAIITMQGARFTPRRLSFCQALLSGLAVFVWMSRERNNISKKMLVSDQAGAATRRQIKKTGG
jgi:hypothetical protein